jgi:type IV secretory pathway VirB2 component (pilin)
MTRRRTTVIVAAGLVAALLAGCQASASTPAAQPVRTTTATATATATGPVAAQLAGLKIKGRAPMTGYSRTKFGPAWPSLHGCDARNVVLHRDLTSTVLRTGGCVVLTGALLSPYTRGVIHFVRGPQSAQVQIDHVVALGDAWQTGAQSWTPTTRETFANDPLELLAVDGHSNEAKGDSDAASWLPPNKGFRCAYAGIQIRVKAKYALWVTQAEHDALANLIAQC